MLRDEITEQGIGDVFRCDVKGTKEATVSAHKPIYHYSHVKVR